MPTRTVAVVPLRAPGAGKTRLAAALDRTQRAELTGAMLRDVVAALRGASMEQIVVAAGGPAAAAAAAALGVHVLQDPPGIRDLNQVIARATRELGSHRDVLIVTADLPRLTAGEVLAMFETDAEVVVAPTNAGGTGGLLRRPGGRILTAYGPGSARRHRHLAFTAGASVTVLDRDGFRHDVDTWTDLVALHEVEVGPATARVLPTMLGHHVRAG